MSNSLLNISMITNESLRQLKNQLGFTKGVNRQYDDKFAKTGAKVGSVINIRKPVRFEVTDGAALNLQDVDDQSIPLTLDQRKHVGFQFSTQELTLSIDEFSDRYIKPAVTALANKVDLSGLAEYKNVWNAVGTPGSTPTTLKTYLQAMQKLDENGAPVDDMRSIAINPAAQTEIVDALKGLFHDSNEVKKQYRRGRMGTAIGADWMMCQNINTHTVGSYGANSPDVYLAGQTGSTINTDGWESGASTVNEGDIVTFDGVYAVNPQTRQSTGQLMQFTVTATISDTTGSIALPISPAIVTSGPYQNVTNSPANDATVTVLGNAGSVSPVNLAYHRDAFVLGCADLELPGGVDMAARATDPESGLSIRLVRQYDINNDTMPCRLDILYGWKTVYSELACRIHG